ncbi:hypothetical protein Pcinc_044253 [Petrolisthes cinctipes]|uniref:Uncharacterized protein n=1 Tax=Petrolisthes cinctipes TaxID=88211 RepID=A0AAE1BE29_PETCI|nr:hypothetical protein Pcinc_044253 [Petrolisthes cinctipes]
MRPETSDRKAAQTQRSLGQRWRRVADGGGVVVTCRPWHWSRDSGGKCRVMCQTLPNCTSSSRFLNDEGEQVCGLSEEPYPPPTFIQNQDATTVIIPSRMVYPPTTTTTTPPPSKFSQYYNHNHHSTPPIRVWISRIEAYDGRIPHITGVCGSESGTATFIPDTAFVNRLIEADTSDDDIDLDNTTGIWINLSYDMTSMKHTLYDGSYFEDAPEFSNSRW